MTDSVEPTPATPLPTPPTRSDPVNFAARGDAFLGALPDYQTELDNIADVTYDNAVVSETKAVEAAASAGESAASAVESATSALESATSATQSAAAANVVKWVSETESPAAFAEGDVVFSPITYSTYRNKTGVNTDVDPSGDPTNWQEITVALPSQLGNEGSFLTTDGSVTSWADPLPDQTGNSGKSLVTDGANNLSWEAVYDVPVGGGVTMPGVYLGDIPTGFIGFTGNSFNASVPRYPSLSGLYPVNSNAGVELDAVDVDRFLSRGFMVTDDYIAVGAHQGSGPVSGLTQDGVVRIFDTSIYTELQTLESPNAENNGNFGSSVYMDPNWLVIGAVGETVSGAVAAGRVYVYQNIGGTYTLSQTLESPTPDASDRFGSAVWVSETGTYLIVGAYNANEGGGTEAGRAYIFTNSGGTFGSAQTLQSQSPEAGGYFGSQVFITDSYAFVGAEREDAGAVSDSGRVYVFANSGGTYSHSQTLESPNGANSGYFGGALTAQGTTLVVGAWQEDLPFANGGVVYVYEESGGTYTLDQTIQGAATTSSRFGSSLDMSGDKLLIGSRTGGPSNNGEVLLYDRGTGSYVEENSWLGASSDDIGADVSLVSLSGGYEIWASHGRTFGSSIEYFHDRYLLTNNNRATAHTYLVRVEA